ncbi:MAG TPA: type II secretion system protein N [Steroidobacteraceae bacterium]|nr:type II secretion system protein N [Steroidobacteraceae bacterium]
MRQGALIAGVGVLVFVAVGVATLPASLLVDRLPPDLKVEGVSGSVWSGGADSIRLRGTPLGGFSWSAEPAALLTGELAFRIAVTRPDGYVRGRIGATIGGALTGRELELELPLTALHPGSQKDWQGQLHGKVQSVRLEKGWPVALVGAFQMTGLTPPASELPIGDYALEFDGRADTPSQLVGRVRDLAAPLVVRAQLVLKRDRSYTLAGEVTPRPDTPPDISRAVRFLGAPDAAGRRTFEITGTF